MTGAGDGVERHPGAPLDLPDEAWITCLSMLDLMGPARLRALLDRASPADAWARVRAGAVKAVVDEPLAEALRPNPARVLDAWRLAACRIDPATVWRRHLDARIGISIRSSASYPTPFRDEPDQPVIVYSRGDPDGMVGHRVAIVGTRDCTRYGYDVARQLGRELTAAGVAVVSGLALGIDAAAHAGAMDAIDAGEGVAPPVAFVGTGLDIVYPRRNRTLHDRVAAAGVVLSEFPLGTQARPWHFPMRNRLIAMLADVTVVVESQEQGGSMITATEAHKRDKLMAVPGPVTSKMSSGTNRLLADGAAVARDTLDILVRIDMVHAARRSAKERRPRPTKDDAVVLDAFAWQPATVEQLMLRTGGDLYGIAVALDRLKDAGWVEQRGGWYERIAKPGG